MKIVYSIILLTALFLPAFSYAAPAPPEPCPCSEQNINETTGAEILAEICPDGQLAPDADLIFTQDEITVSLDEPIRLFGVGPFGPVGQPGCQLGVGPGGVLVGISEVELEICRATIIESCGLNPINTRAIPTLSEWGLIVMAGVLGLVGLLVVRRKRATA